MNYAGIIDRMSGQTWPSYKEIKETDFEPIEIQEVIQIHILLLAGYFLSSLVLLFEAFVNKRKIRKERLVKVFPVHSSFRMWYGMIGKGRIAQI